MEKEPVVEIKDLVKHFGDRRVLNGVNLTVYRGETFVLMGGSGCGKSTLLRHMIGSHKPDSGKVFLLGKDISELEEDGMDVVRKRIGMLFQSAALFDSMTVGENVSLPLKEHTKLDEDVIKNVVKMKLELVGLRGFDPEVLVTARQLLYAAVKQHEIVHEFDQALFGADLHQVLVQLVPCVLVFILLPRQEVLLGRTDRAVAQPFRVVAREHELNGAEEPGVEFG